MKKSKTQKQRERYNPILSKGRRIEVSKIVGKTKLIVENNCLTPKTKIIVPKKLLERIYDLLEKGVKFKRR